MNPSKSFSQSIMSIFIFVYLNIFFNRFFLMEKAFLTWLCQCLSFLNIFSIDFARWKKLFLIDCVNSYLFSIFFFNKFCPMEKVFFNWLCQCSHLFSNRFWPEEKSFLNWLCQYWSFFKLFFNRFCPVEKCRVTPFCLLGFINFNFSKTKFSVYIMLANSCEKLQKFSLNLAMWEFLR